MADKRTAAQIFEDWSNRTHSWSDFLSLATENPCLRIPIVKRYNQIQMAKPGLDSTPPRSSIEDKRMFFSVNKQQANAHKIVNDNIENGTKRDSDANLRIAAYVVWNEDREGAYEIMKLCAGKIASQRATPITSTSKDLEYYTLDDFSRPFDRRLWRVEQYIKGNSNDILPFSIDYSEVATSGYIMSEKSINEIPKNTDKRDELIAKRKADYLKMAKDERLFKGVPALQNTYALVKLYGSEGGKYLVNQKNKRRWYEVDTANDQFFNFASTPTTTALIDWGKGDPYGRTPYHFTDFVFSKYWKKIENNRLITLRRYPAPIYDNLKFPGMTGSINVGTNEKSGNSENDKDSGSRTSVVSFAPMASAVTYFGGETGNSLKDLLSFTTGVNWGEAQGSVWEVNSRAPAPDNTTGLGKIFGSLAGIAEKLNVAAGNFNPEYIAAGGVMPPDPYKDGPYENRIQGVVNRIDKVWKREPGLKFEWNGLKLTFEYVARPIGGINPKAVLLDILSNFLVIGSASAVFFGGAHRFMIDPAKYPLIGGKNTHEKMYRGEIIGASLDAIKAFTGEKSVTNTAFDNVMKSLKAFWAQLIGGGNTKESLFGGFESILTGGIGNLVANEIAKSTSGQVPYLQGLRAILTGEPVGEWHVTIGNPLNPIAMIGNLICDNIEIQFNEELGPDDFPTEIKIVVNLKHGMARDRDAIESAFNRGMGRIYNLPDSYLGSADAQTIVDAYTKGGDTVGKMMGGKTGFIYQRGMDSRYVDASTLAGTTNSMAGSVSVWDRYSFKAGLSENSNISFNESNEILRSSYKAMNWVAYRALL